MRRSTKRIVLWKKQRQFLESCLDAKMNVTQILSKHAITNKMLMLWYSKAAFKHRFNRIRRFLDKRRDLDLIIGATHGANLLSEQQLKRSRASERKRQFSMAMVKLVEPRRRPRRPSRKSKRPPLPDLAHPDNSPEENERLLSVLVNK